MIVEEGFSKGPCLRRVLIYLCVCISVVSLASTEEVSAHENDGANFVVHVTDEGFEPQTLEVQSGETVVFENAGQKPHWPASDDHPTHTKYPEFAPLKPLEPETQWSFTFDKLGEWKYHDHQNPYLKGEVLVREDPGASDGFLAFIQTFFLYAYRTAASIFASEEGEATSNEETTRELPD